MQCIQKPREKVDRVTLLCDLEALFALDNHGLDMSRIPQIKPEPSWPLLEETRADSRVL